MEIFLQNDRVEVNARLKTVNMTAGHIQELCRLSPNHGHFTSASQFPNNEHFDGTLIGL